MNIMRKVFIWIFKDQLEEVQKALHQANKLNNLLQAEVSKVQNIHVVSIEWKSAGEIMSKYKTAIVG